RSRWRSLTQTLAPARAIWMAIARPTPAPEPVTMAVRPPMKFDQSRIIGMARSSRESMRSSDLEDDGDDRGPALRARVDEATESPPGVAPQRLEVGGPLRGGIRQRRTYRRLRLLEQVGGLGLVDPAPGDDVGPRHQLARRGVD